MYLCNDGKVRNKNSLVPKIIHIRSINHFESAIMVDTHPNNFKGAVAEILIAETARADNANEI